MKKIRKPTPDYFGLRALEKIILRELEATEGTAEKRKNTDPQKNSKKPPEANPEAHAEPAATETADASGNWDDYTGVFTQEEQRFISETIEWLVSRENRDSILEQIMRGVDDARPSPAEVHLPEAPPISDAAADVPAETH